MSLTHLLRPLLPSRRLLATLALPLALAACSSSDDDDRAADASPGNETPDTGGPSPSPYLDARPGDLLEVAIAELQPTQAAIGYDQVYYKLGRWQPDLARPTWQNATPADPAQHLKYLNRTLGKKFEDFCEDMGAGTISGDFFATLDDALAATLSDRDSFACPEALGTHTDILKTVVVGPAGRLYLTDGHHTFSSLYEIADGGPELKVIVKVDQNYSDASTTGEFWQRMVTHDKVWLRDGDNNAITPEQLPTRVGMMHEDQPGGMAEDAYRSLVYFTRSIGYDNGGLPEFAEFYWADWLRGQVVAGTLRDMSQYKLRAPATLAEILDEARINGSLQPTRATDSYPAMVRDAALLMSRLGDADVVSGTRTAAELGRIRLDDPANIDSGVTKDARDEMEELARNDVNSSGGSRGAGKLWFAANYRHCGAAATDSCWGWTSN